MRKEKANVGKKVQLALSICNSVYYVLHLRLVEFIGKELIDTECLGVECPWILLPVADPGTSPSWILWDD